MPPALARRYLFKLLANIASVPVYLVMEAILPRALGPQTYGNFSFATSLFQQFSGFLDMGTSTCLYNSLSRRHKERSLFTFYFRIIAAVAALTLLCGFILIFPFPGGWLLPDVPGWIAPLAALWAFLTWLGRALRSVNDALGETIPSEIWRSVCSLAAAALLVALFAQGWLNIQTLFVQQYILLGSSALAFWLVCDRAWRRMGVKAPERLSKEEARAYSREFFNYSHPLFTQSLISFGMLAAERWLLQWFDGSVQQGFFALSQKVSLACFLFVSAMTPLLMRELSIAWGKGDLESMGSLLTRFAPLLYGIAAYFSCFTLVEGRSLVRIFGGEEFLAATLAVQIMALYPLHQAYGQMAGSVFHACGKTRILRDLTALECVYGLAAAWFLLAPRHLFGLGLGAAGLAIKTVGVQFLSVNICLWLASRYIPFNFWRNLIHQIIAAAVFLAAAFLARQTLLQLMPESGLFFWRFLLSGVLYSLEIGGLCLLFPRLLGLSRQELRDLAVRFRLLPRR